MASFHKRKRLEEFQAPEKEGPSKHEILVKQLTKNQQNIHINLEDELANEKCFIKSTQLLPITNFHFGSAKLKEFQSIDEHATLVEGFRQKGLTDEDIDMYFSYQNGIDFLFEKHKKYEKNLLLSRIESIVNIVKQVQTDSSERKDVLPHPMDGFSKYEKDFMKQINDNTQLDLKHIRKKARKLGNRLNDKVIFDSKPENDKSNHNSNWDVKQIQNIAIPKIIEKKIYTCKKKQFYTIRNNAIVTVEEAKMITISEERLSLDQIRKLPKFQNYIEGKENKILYIKNLPNQMKENHLLEIFTKYKQTISVKLLNGRMKGQAFITFSDQSMAKLALNEHNGRLINGKPMIIQFGNRK